MAQVLITALALLLGEFGQQSNSPILPSSLVIISLLHALHPYLSSQSIVFPSAKEENHISMPSKQKQTG